MKAPVFIHVSGGDGVRNDLSPERFSKKDLCFGNNIEIDETGKIYKRLGTSKAIHTGDMHSLWSDGVVSFVVKDNVLYRVDPSVLSLVPLSPVNGRVCYARANTSVFWSDGLVSGEVTIDGTARRAGIEVPPTLSASLVPGNMRSGRYIYTMVYVRGDDTEGGAALYGVIELPATHGIQFTLPVSTDPTVVRKRLYLSSWNGGKTLLAGEYSNAETTALIASTSAFSPVALRTELMGPTPAGQALAFYNGRLYVAENNYLWYSQPYEFGLFKLMENYMAFSSPVKTLAVVSDGIFVGSDDETVFLMGGDPANFVRKPVASYGTVLGTEKAIPGHYVGEEGVADVATMWMSKKGVCLGMSGGVFKNLTGGKYTLPAGVSQGASLFKLRGGTPQLITSLM